MKWCVIKLCPRAATVRYLDVIVVLARQPHGQFAFGPGAPFPQPTHFRRELQVSGVREGGVDGQACGRVAFSHKRQKDEEKGRGEETDKGKWRDSGQSKRSKATSGINHKYRR